jgi:hypothetical protein
MTLALLVTALLGQTMYEWTDSRGEVHFTDDKSSIPKGAKVKTTEGEELTTIDAPPMPTTSKPGKSTGQPIARCADSKKKVDALEARLTKAKEQHELALLRWQGNCAEVRSKFGADEEARCLRRGRKSAAPPEPNYAALEKETEAAADAHRRAQVSGCTESR